MPNREIRGAKLEVVERAGGPETVVFVHGSLSDHRTWEKQLELLPARYRGVTYSRRFHWPNAPPQPGDEYRMGDHADDLAELIRQLGGPVHLVGNSWGAFTSLVVAMRRPELVKSLVLEEPPVVPLFLRVPPGPLDLAKLFVTAPRAGVTLLRFLAGTLVPAGKHYERGEDEAGRSRFMLGVLGKEPLGRLPEARIAQARDNVPAHKAEARAQGGFEPITAAGVAKVAAPVLLVEGERSPPLFGALTRRLRSILRGAEHATIPGASHVMHEEAPEATARAIADFLGRQ